MKNRRLRDLFWIICILISTVACTGKVPLNRKNFTALMIDIHTVDAILMQTGSSGLRSNYLYYNNLFDKYGITRADFDSCVNYYSGETRLFAKIYEAVIDTLSCRETDHIKIVNSLTREDSINLFTGYYFLRHDTLDTHVFKLDGEALDTLYAEAEMEHFIAIDTVRFDSLNPFLMVRMDSIVPGFYEFKTRIKLDSLERGRVNNITSCFISPFGDTLRPMDIRLRSDTTLREYTWSYFISDSVEYKLHIKLLDTITKQVRSGFVHDSRLYKKYMTEKEQEMHRSIYSRRDPSRTDSRRKR